MRSTVHALPREATALLIAVVFALAGCSSGEKANADSTTAKSADTAAATAALRCSRAPAQPTA